jgi:hypothetical protein
MNLHMIQAAAALLLAVAVTTPASAQTAQTAQTVSTDTTATLLHEIRMQDGSRLYVRIIGESADTLTVETAGGLRMELPRSRIAAMSAARGRVVDGQFWRDDPNHTRLLFTPTARALGRGEGYVSSFMLFFPFVAVGVTDRFTIAGGTPLLPGAMGEVIYLAPKLTVLSQPGIDLAVGIASVIGLRQDAGESVGVLYGAGTFGDRDNAFTAGAGWGYEWGRNGGDMSDHPALMLGAETRVGRSLKLVSENWVFGGARAGMLSGGLRFIGENLTADLGLGLLLFDGEAACCLPLVNFVYNFR